jgi:hypothetical protein
MNTIYVFKFPKLSESYLRELLEAGYAARILVVVINPLHIICKPSGGNITAEAFIHLARVCRLEGQSHADTTVVVIYIPP